MWLSVTLTHDEKTALTRMAQVQRRSPRDQAALIIRRELEHQGFLLPQDSPHDKAVSISQPNVKREGIIMK